MWLWLVLIGLIACMLPGNVGVSRRLPKSAKGVDEPKERISEDGKGPPMKVQVTLTEAEASELDWLRRKVGMTKPTDVIDLALDLLYWAVRCRSRGWEVCSYDSEDGTVAILTNRSLDRVAHRAGQSAAKQRKTGGR